MVAIIAFSAGISWFVVYRLGWRYEDLFGLSHASHGVSFAVYAVIIGLGFVIAAAPVLVLARVYKKHAGEAGDTGKGVL